MTTLHVYEAVGFILGLAFGSFLNVCISRIPKGESVIHPRSRCPRCEAAIRWYDNIPLLSWLLLRGRCRDCHAGISWRYPAVEFTTGLWLLHTAKLFWDATHLDATMSAAAIPSPSASQIAIYLLAVLGLAILGFLLIGLIVMDWQTFTLPDAFTLTGIAIALFLVCTQAIFLGPTEDQVLLTRHSLHLTSPGGVTDHGNVFLTGPESLIFGRIAAICGTALILLIIRWLYKALRHREGMGLGDVKLLAMIAAFLGFWPAILALFIGVLIAGLYGIVLLAQRRAGAASKLAFGSFLSIGGLISALFGNTIIDRYIALIR
ncbi:MAG: Prepilin peptidase [Edaphobacter sp.]|nr:Prepilin peptidase [Edaphobacter sp.]